MLLLSEKSLCVVDGSYCINLQLIKIQSVSHKWDICKKPPHLSKKKILEELEVMKDFGKTMANVLDRTTTFMISWYLFLSTQDKASQYFSMDKELMIS